MWLVGGLVRLFYENEAKRSFDRHMFKANHTAVWKRIDACWIQVDADQLVPGDVIRLYAGMLCPVDAVLAKGDHILVSESSLTGESGQTAKREGETVRAGTTIVDGKASAAVLACIAEEPPTSPRRARLGMQFGAGARSICAALVRCMLIVLPFIQSRASAPVMLLTMTGIAVLTLIPFSPLGPALGLGALPVEYFLFLIPCILLYMALATSLKKSYVKRYGELL